MTFDLSIPLKKVRRSRSEPLRIPVRAGSLGTLRGFGQPIIVRVIKPLHIEIRQIRTRKKRIEVRHAAVS